MQEQQPIDFTDAVLRSKLSVTEIAAVFNVTRVTASAWINGRSKPHRLHRDTVQRTIDKIIEAIDDGRLPLAVPARNHAKTRMAKLKEIFPEARA